MMASQRQSRGTLQKQGVPIPAKLEGPDGNQQRATQTRRSPAPQRQSRPRVRQSRNRSRAFDAAAAGAGAEAARRYSPTQYADKTTTGVGLLEAEYFGIVFLLLIELFTDTGDTYTNKMMSFMKRGLLTSMLFFFLALIAAIGDNAAKVSKAIGGLVLIAILLSSPGQAIITALDNFVKADWQGSSETAGDTAGSADAGTTNTATSAPGELQKIEDFIGSGLSIEVGGPTISNLKGFYNRLKGLF